jgi:hypothetical protein
VVAPLQGGRSEWSCQPRQRSEWSRRPAHLLHIKDMGYRLLLRENKKSLTKPKLKDLENLGISFAKHLGIFVANNFRIVKSWNACWLNIFKSENLLMWTGQSNFPIQEFRKAKKRQHFDLKILKLSGFGRFPLYREIMDCA